MKISREQLSTPRGGYGVPPPLGNMDQSNWVPIPHRTIAWNRPGPDVMRFEPIVHVKDGVPLTPQGAKMLGVPWNG